jgi:cation transport ATPase
MSGRGPVAFLVVAGSAGVAAALHALARGDRDTERAVDECGLLLSPRIAAAAMSLSSVSVIGNALRGGSEWCH